MMAREQEHALADHVRVRHLGTVTPAEAGLWPSLEIVEHTGTAGLALVLMSDVGARQLGEGASHDEVGEIAAQILSMRGQGVPALLHKLALGYCALHCQHQRLLEGKGADAKWASEAPGKSADAKWASEAPGKSADAKWASEAPGKSAEQAR